MGSDDITVQILTDIRDEIRATNSRLDQTNVRLERLEQRGVASEILVATAITDVAGTIREVRDRFDDRLELRARVERCERDIDDLKRRGS